VSLAFRGMVSGDEDKEELRELARASVQKSEFDEKTRQEFKADCDINKVIRRFVRDGFMGLTQQAPPQFADVSQLGDYRSMLEQVRAAEAYFARLPAKVRARFGNDPARYIDEARGLSREELRELGMAELRKDDPRPQHRRRAADVETPPAREGEGG